MFNNTILKLSLLDRINKAVDKLDTVALNRLEDVKVLSYTDKIKLEGRREAYKQVFEIINSMYNK